MLSGSYEILQADGFLFTRVSARVDLLHADFGDGYRSAARIGSKEGLHSWSVKIDVLPDDEDYSINGEETGIETRANYLFNFFLRSKAASNKPFWIQCPRDFKFYLAEFVDDEIDYDILCSRLFSAGLNLRQRRVSDQESPTSAEEILNPAHL